MQEQLKTYLYDHNFIKPRSHLCMRLSANSLRQKKVAIARHRVYNLRIICVEAACISDRLD